MSLWNKATTDSIEWVKNANPPLILASSAGQGFMIVESLVVCHRQFADRGSDVGSGLDDQVNMLDRRLIRLRAHLHAVRFHRSAALGNRPSVPVHVWQGVEPLEAHLLLTADPLTPVTGAGHEPFPFHLTSIHVDSDEK